MAQIENLKTEQKFKKTEAGEIPVEWGVIKIENILTLSYGDGLPEEERKAGAYPVYGSNGIIGYHDTALVKGPGIILGRKETIGTVEWSENDFWPIDTTYYVSVGCRNSDLRWLYYQLQILKLNKLNTATGIPGLNREVVLKLSVPYPPLIEQKKIAEILLSVDSAIEKNSQLIEKKKELKKGLMQELLSRGIDHKKFKKTEAGEIPVEWEVMSLGEASKEIYRYPTYYNIKYVEKGIPEVRGELIMPNGTLETDMSLYRFISEETAAQFPRTRLEDGDFVISVRGTMGKVGLVPKELNGANMTANLIRISPDRNRIFPFWLQQVFISERFQEQLNQASSSTTIKTIKAPELESLKLGVPTIPEQKKIAEILSNVDEEIEQEAAEKSKIEQLKKGLMQALLTGKVRVKV